MPFNDIDLKIFGVEYILPENFQNMSLPVEWHNKRTVEHWKVLIRKLLMLHFEDPLLGPASFAKILAMLLPRLLQKKQ